MASLSSIVFIEEVYKLKNEINRLMGARDEARDRACQAEEEVDRLLDVNNRLNGSLMIADQEVHRLMDVITEQAAEIRGLQEEAADYRNEINLLREELKQVKAFMCIGEGI